MSKKKKQQSQRNAPPAPPPAPEAPYLPAPIRALDADYSQVLRMRNVRWLIVMAAVVGALILGWYLSAVFVPLLVALATAYILNPLVVKLQKKGISRTRAVLWIFIMFIVLGAAVGSWVALSVVRDVQEISAQAQDMWEDFKANKDEWVASYNEIVPGDMQLDPKEDAIGKVGEAVVKELFPSASQVEEPERVAARAAMTSARADLLAAFQQVDKSGDMVLTPAEVDAQTFKAMDKDGDERVTTDEWFIYFGSSPPTTEGRGVSPQTQQAVDKLVSYIGDGLAGVLTLLLFITLVPIYTWYFMVGFDKVVAKGREYLPGAHRPRIEKILTEIDAMMRAFFRGRIVVVFIITVLTTIVYLVFGVKYAVLLGLMSGLGVLIPYFSMVAGWIPAIIIMLISGDSWGAIIGMSIGFHVIQAFEQYVLTPRLLGNAVELHPVTLLVGVFVMASLFGLFGALLAVPLTAIAKTLGREFLLPYFKSLASEKPSARAPPASA
ncbi:MAG: AI-2E family transporter [Planctomycetes bacterium]|nr:AI-2E family transporter [Planctomycetota bacterium]MCW8137116.1 AI-2E family transporter [Planctomycetota bacterium]